MVLPRETALTRTCDVVPFKAFKRCEEIDFPSSLSRYCISYYRIIWAG